ncbi:hypothetical protein HK096_006366 [Nowakowskiella sp. JEL0078]|nr:hypothetical protein HK096_006366 [Nowakowskiella sp. JEL0078]
MSKRKNMKAKSEISAESNKLQKQEIALNDEIVNPKPILYRRPWSAATRVHHLIVELGLEDEINVFTVEKYPEDLKTAEFKAMHPLGKIPVYKDGSFVLFEAGAIFLYLVDKHREKVESLGLLTDSQRPKLYQYLFMGISELYKWSGILYEHMIATEEEKKVLQKQVDAIREDWVNNISPFLERELAGNQYLAGNEFSLIDVALFYDLASLEFFGLPFEKGSPLELYMNRMKERESYKKVF